MLPRAGLPDPEQKSSRLDFCQEKKSSHIGRPRPAAGFNVAGLFLLPGRLGHNVTGFFFCLPEAGRGRDWIFFMFPWPWAGPEWPWAGPEWPCAGPESTLQDFLSAGPAGLGMTGFSFSPGRPHEPHKVRHC